MIIGTFVILLVAGFGALLLPFIAFIVVKRQLPSSWRIFFVGMLTFFISQLVLRLPWQLPLAKWGAVHANTGWAFVALAVFSALTAGLFEETGRYLAYKFFAKRPSVNDGIALGLGHGGFESALLVGVSVIANAILAYVIANNLGAVPPEMSNAMTPLIQQASSSPWYLNLAGLYERIMAITAHVAMSLLVYLAFVRKSVKFFLYAVGVHMLLDAGGVLTGKYGGVLAVEGLMTLVGILSFAWIVRVVKAERV